MRPVAFDCSAYFNGLLSAYQRALQSKNREEIERVASELRRSIFKKQVPYFSREELLLPELPTQRGRIWKILLGVDSSTVSVAEYLRCYDLPYVQADLGQIEKDWKRATQSPLVKRRAPECVCQRVFRAVLNWWFEKTLDRPKIRESYLNKDKVDITQGPLRHLLRFLTVMPELDAFFCFREWYALVEPSVSVSPSGGLKNTLELSLLVAAEYYALCKQPKPTGCDYFGCPPQIIAYAWLSSGHTQVLADEESDYLVIWDAMVARGYHFNFYLSLARLLLTYPNPSTLPTKTVQSEQQPAVSSRELINRARLREKNSSEAVRQQVLRLTYCG